MSAEQPGTDSASMTDRIAAQFGIVADEPEEQAEGLPQDVGASAEEEPAQEDTEQAGEQSAKDSEAFEEVDLDGEVYRVPPKLKEAVLRQADYTRKTQELAEHRRLLETQKQAIQIANAYQQATAQEQAQLRDIESRLAGFQEVKWAELDGETMLRAKVTLDSLNEQARQLRASLDAKKSQFAQYAEQAKEQFRARRAESLSRLVPGWNSQADIDATRAALEVGFQPEEVRDGFDDRMGVLAWKAAQFDKLQAGKTAAVQQVKKAPPVIKPGATNPMPSEVKARLAYRKELAQAKDSQSKANVIAKRLEGMFK